METMKKSEKDVFEVNKGGKRNGSQFELIFA